MESTVRISSSELNNDVGGGTRKYVTHTCFFFQRSKASPPEQDSRSRRAHAHNNTPLFKDRMDGEGSERNREPQELVLWSADPHHDACLIEHDMQDHKDLIDSCVHDVRPLLEKHPYLGVMYGSPCYMRRSVRFFARIEDTYGYFYSGQCSESHPPPDTVSKLREIINDKRKSKFNGTLVNLYDPEDYISPHKDDERGLASSPGVGVISVSWGARRTMRIRDASTKKIVFDATTKPYTALEMRGADFQKFFTHEIPKASKRGGSSGVRVSFTFREHVKAQEEEMWKSWLSKRDGMWHHDSSAKRLRTE